ncbi:hypothetical protein F8M41_011497 [Gigaspora margarita]|uniref:Uncharacterized protein n=1 Tax=Gigaspora margarita TaxID=4874 RepID=A0A8H3X2A4_GIGMA|nr:hypothetical protein F8M41_011497 [Gigaspora margarita]
MILGPISELLTELEEIERYKTKQLSGAYLYLGPALSAKSHRKDNYSSNISMTKTEIKNLIKSMMPSIQSQPIISQLLQSDYRPQPPGTSQIIQDTNKDRFLQWLIGEIPEFVSVPSPIYPQNCNNENSMTSSENELETNTLAHSWNEAEFSSSKTSKSSNSESNSEEYEVNVTKKNNLF